MTAESPRYQERSERGGPEHVPGTFRTRRPDPPFPLHDRYIRWRRENFGDFTSQMRDIQWISSIFWLCYMLLATDRQTRRPRQNDAHEINGFYEPQPHHDDHDLG